MYMPTWIICTLQILPLYIFFSKYIIFHSTLIYVPDLKLEKSINLSAEITECGELADHAFAMLFHPLFYPFIHLIHPSIGPASK